MGEIGLVTPTPGLVQPHRLQWHTWKGQPLGDWVLQHHCSIQAGVTPTWK